MKADQTYEGFTAHETTLSSDGVALVRVTYKVHLTLPGDQRTVVEVAEPGEDWGVEKVDDLAASHRR